MARLISDKSKNTWKMTKNDSPSAILLCTSIITILLTVKLHNILFQQTFITSFITKISMPQLSVTKLSYNELYIVTTTKSKSIELTVQIYVM